MFRDFIYAHAIHHSLASIWCTDFLPEYKRDSVVVIATRLKNIFYSTRNQNADVYANLENLQLGKRFITVFSILMVSQM